MSIIDQNDLTSLFNRVNDNVFIKRHQCTWVNDFYRDTFFCQFFSCLHDTAQHFSVGNNCYISTFFFDFANAKRNNILRIDWHFPFLVKFRLIFQDNNWVIVSDRSFEETFHISWSTWCYYLQSWNVGKPRFQRLRVLSRRANSITSRTTNGHWNLPFTAKHIASFSRLVDDIIHGNHSEVHEGHIDDWAKASHGCSCCCSRNSCF